MKVPFLSDWWNSQKAQMLTDALRIADFVNNENAARNAELLKRLDALEQIVKRYDDKEIVADVRGVAALVADVVNGSITRGLLRVDSTIKQELAIASAAEKKLMDALEPPRATRKAGTSRYMRILAEKGMAGSPVECDACGSIFSDRWPRCDKCGKSKEQMPPSCWIVV